MLPAQTVVDRKKARNFASLPAVAPQGMDLRQQLRAGRPPPPSDPHSSGGPHTSVSSFFLTLLKDSIIADKIDGARLLYSGLTCPWCRCPGIWASCNRSRLLMVHCGCRLHPFDCVQLADIMQSMLRSSHLASMWV